MLWPGLRLGFGGFGGLGFGGNARRFVGDALGFSLGSQKGNHEASKSTTEVLPLVPRRDLGIRL